MKEFQLDKSLTVFEMDGKICVVFDIQGRASVEKQTLETQQGAISVHSEQLVDLVSEGIARKLYPALRIAIANKLRNSSS